MCDSAEVPLRELNQQTSRVLARVAAGVGLPDAMNVALAAAFQTADIVTTDGHFSMMRPLTGQPSFRLLPDDL